MSPSLGTSIFCKCGPKTAKTKGKKKGKREKEGGGEKDRERKKERRKEGRGEKERKNERKNEQTNERKKEKKGGREGGRKERRRTSWANGELVQRKGQGDGRAVPGPHAHHRMLGPHRFHVSKLHAGWLVGNLPQA